MATIMGIIAEKNKVNLTGMSIKVEKHMSKNAPRRISALDVQIDVPRLVSEREKRLLENAALSCPVAQSINPTIKVNTNFKWKSR
jgi:uncharacterized OsmC-like protein